MDKDGYPEESELLDLKKWDFSKSSIDDFLKEIERLWHWPDWGFFLKPGRTYYPLSIFKRQRVLHLILHTGGWSGNESIIESLQQNFIFWPMCWVKSVRGGHYWFEIIKKNFKK